MLVDYGAKINSFLAILCDTSGHVLLQTTSLQNYAANLIPLIRNHLARQTFLLQRGRLILYQFKARAFSVQSMCLLSCIESIAMETANLIRVVTKHSPKRLLQMFGASHVWQFKSVVIR